MKTKENDSTTDTNSAPQCHAEKCPVCNGFTTVGYNKFTCAACKGKGYVIVPNIIEQID